MKGGTSFTLIWYMLKLKYIYWYAIQMYLFNQMRVAIYSFKMISTLNFDCKTLQYTSILERNSSFSFDERILVPGATVLRQCCDFLKNKSHHDQQNKVFLSNSGQVGPWAGNGRSPKLMKVGPEHCKICPFTFHISPVPNFTALQQRRPRCPCTIVKWNNLSNI